MIPNKLIEAVVVFVFMAAAAGHLPELTKFVRVAQLRALKASQSSNWKKPMMPPTQKISYGVIRSR